MTLQADTFMASSWPDILHRRSMLELPARARAAALLDSRTMRELCGPFDRLESPWLLLQGIVPEADDGVVIARGAIGGRPVVVAAVEQGFQGGGIGEVSGAKISQALRMAAAQSRAGNATAAVLLLETGGVRLQEANLGLNAVAEICSALLDLRALAPVVGVVVGAVGCFGGMGIVAGLCTQIIVTPQARIGLNGPAVIEQEAGAEEFDSEDRALVWAVDGGAQRYATGLADTLVPDDVDALRAAVTAAVAAGATTAGDHRSERLDILEFRLAGLDPAHPPTPDQLRTAWASAHEQTSRSTVGSAPARHNVPAGRGRTWLTALAGVAAPTGTASVLRADTDDATYLAVVQDPGSPFPRARAGQVGLIECLALARSVRAVVTADAAADRKRAIVAVVDLPSQAYGRLEEMIGLHQAIAATVDAYHAARTAGHPVVALVVGSALSGGFLAHGMQAARILALDDQGVTVHAMGKQAAARITQRTVEELDVFAATVLPLSYDIRDWARLGFCDGLLHTENPDQPSDEDVDHARGMLADAIDRARRGPHDLSNRLTSPGAEVHRIASRRAYALIEQQWERQ